MRATSVPPRPAASPPREAPLPQLSVVSFEPYKAVRRSGGGAFVLGNAGELARVSPHGELSGTYATPLIDLLATAQFVCGLAGDGSVYCAVDHHPDFSCTDAAEPLVLRRLEHERVDSLTHDPVSNTLCAAAEEQGPSCFRVQASCEMHCLAWPPCAPPRCVDPCAPGELPQLRAVPAGPKISSSSPARAETDRG